MNSYTFFWTNDTWDRHARNAKLPIGYIAGMLRKPFSEIKKGDEIFVITVKRNRLYVGGRLIADRDPVNKSEAIGLLPGDTPIPKEAYVIADRRFPDPFRGNISLDAEEVRTLEIIDKDGKITFRKFSPTSFPQDFLNANRISESSAEKLRDSLSISGGVKNLDPSIPNDAKQDPVILADAQASLESDTRSLTTAEREAVVKVRYGQGNFREALLKAGEEKCWMSGIEGKRLLVASHIKPWSHCESDTDSRGQPNNGLLLSALWDTAFDAGLICFDSDWKVVASSELSDSAKGALGLGKHLALPEKFRTDGRRNYLAYHRAEVFEYWKKTASQKKDIR